MDDINSIEELRKQFLVEIKGKELKDFATRQQVMIEDLLQRNKILEAKLKSAQITKSSVLSNATQITPEERICIEQLELLSAKSSERELSLDECKRLDILVKNLRLIQSSPTIVDVESDYTKQEIENLVALVTPGST